MSRTRPSSSSSPQWAQRPRPSSESSGSRIVPGSQWAPWITHGTMCSRRQKIALRSPTGSAARKPSPSDTSTPHQLHGPELIEWRTGYASPPSLSWARMTEGLKTTVREGDETGQELLEQSLRVLDPEVVGLPIELDRYDLSLERRRETDNQVVHEAARAMRDSGFGIKAATVTPEG